jgi:hypothetical protein
MAQFDPMDTEKTSFSLQGGRVGIVSRQDELTLI